MTRFRTSAPDHWTMPRAHRDPAQRRRIHDPLVPLHTRATAKRDRLAIFTVAALLAIALTTLLVVAG